MTAETPPEQRLGFSVARDNFYAAAQHGLGAHVTWLDGARGSVQQLLQGIYQLFLEHIIRIIKQLL